MKKSAETVATIGVFDGVHVGHQFLLNRVHEVAKARGMLSLAVTFDPSPAEFFSGQSSAHCSLFTNHSLLTLAERLERLLEAGMDRVEVMTFDRELARMTAAQFMVLLKERLNVRVLVMGYDHRFGCEQHKDAAFYDAAAKEVGLEIIHVSAYGDVSSTLVRESLLCGDVEKAQMLLGYPYYIKGTVVTGDGRGHKLGFPTANLAVVSGKLIPATGVYAVGVRIDQQVANHCSLITNHLGMMNIGLCPTFGGRTERRIEVHILDFDADIYGQTLTASLMCRLRDERKFSSVEALVSQLETDAARIRSLNIKH